MVGKFPKDAPAKRLGISVATFPIGGKRRCQESLRQLLVFFLLPRLLEGARPDLVLQVQFPRMNPFLRYYGAQVIRDQHKASTLDDQVSEGSERLFEGASFVGYGIG